jgi:ribosome-associated protein
LKETQAQPIESTEAGDVQVDGIDPETVGDPETLERVRTIARLAWEKKATDIRALRVFELVNYTDWFIIASARSDRQVHAIWRHIDDTMRAEFDLKPLSVEGSEQNQWVILDYGEVVVHIYYEPVRFFYELENLWGDAPALTLDLPDEDLAASRPYTY